MAKKNDLLEGAFGQTTSDKGLGAAVGLGMLGSTVRASGASDYPNRHIKVIAGSPRGAMLDPLLRALAETARTTLKQPIVVEAKPGAGGVCRPCRSTSRRRMATPWPS